MPRDALEEIWAEQERRGFSRQWSCRVDGVHLALGFGDPDVVHWLPALGDWTAAQWETWTERAARNLADAYRPEVP